MDNNTVCNSNLLAEKTIYKNNTYEIVSAMSYMIGVPEHILKSSTIPNSIETYEKLNNDKNSRIIRHLCIIRTAIERNFGNINKKMRLEPFRTIRSMAEYIPSSSISQLDNDGIDFVKKTSTQLNHHIIEINRVICDRINNCKYLFPTWLEWDYIRDLFIMPDGLTEEGTRAAANVYFSNLSLYPFQMYINWEPRDEGNIFANDTKFVKLLYSWHGKNFEDYNKVSDASNYIKDNIYEFIAESNKIIIVVDCENSDPYKLCASLRGLSSEYIEKIQNIILFDDIHTSTAWSILENYIPVPVERLLIDRIKKDKSLVDHKLIARVCKEHYQNNVDSFVIVSSDSDYWGLISSLDNARFLVMAERDKCGYDMRNALKEEEIFFCYIDDFYSGNCEDMKMFVLTKELHQYIDNAIQLNVNDMLDTALTTARISMASSERKQFYDRYIKNMKLVIAENGDVSVRLNVK